MEATDGDSNTKHKTPAKCPNTIRSPLFVHEVQRIIDKNHKNSLGVIAKGLIVLRHFIRRIMGCGAERWISSLVRQKNRLICAKHWLTKLKNQKPRLLSFFSLTRNTLIRNNRSTEERTNVHAECSNRHAHKVPDNCAVSESQEPRERCNDSSLLSSKLKFKCCWLWGDVWEGCEILDRGR